MLQIGNMCPNQVPIMGLHTFYPGVICFKGYMNQIKLQEELSEVW